MALTLGTPPFLAAFITCFRLGFPTCLRACLAAEKCFRSRCIVPLHALAFLLSFFCVALRMLIILCIIALALVFALPAAPPVMALCMAITREFILCSLRRTFLTPPVQCFFRDFLALFTAFATFLTTLR